MHILYNDNLNKFLIKFFINNDNTKRTIGDFNINWFIKKNYIIYYNDIIRLTPFIQDNLQYKIYCILNNIYDADNIPKCVCGNNLKFISCNKGFRPTCGKKICIDNYKKNIMTIKANNYKILNEQIKNDILLIDLRNIIVDSILINNFINKNLITKYNKINHRKVNYKWFKDNNYINILLQIIKRTEYLDINCSITERIFNIKNNINNLSTCPICKINKVLFNNNHYQSTCNTLICRHINQSRNNIGIKNPSYNKKQSAELIKKRFDARRGYRHSTETKQLISKSLKIAMNDPIYKKTHRLSLIKNGIYIKQSNTMKRKIAEGAFTPCVTNSWANSKCKLVIDGFESKYRSSWEAVFQILNPTCKYEKLRVQYISPKDNNTHNYIVDFIDYDNYITYEIKPECNTNDILNIIKEQSLIKWCVENNYKYVRISNKWFIDNAFKVDYTKYDEKILKGMRQFLI